MNIIFAFDLFNFRQPTFPYTLRSLNQLYAQDFVNHSTSHLDWYLYIETPLCASLPQIMASVNDLHADSDTYAMDIVPPHFLTISPAQASTAGPELSIEPSTPKRIGRWEWNQYERFIRLNYHRMELKELRKLIFKEHSFIARWRIFWCADSW